MADAGRILTGIGKALTGTSRALTDFEEAKEKAENLKISRANLTAKTEQLNAAAKFQKFNSFLKLVETGNSLPGEVGIGFFEENQGKMQELGFNLNIDMLKRDRKEKSRLSETLVSGLGLDPLKVSEEEMGMAISALGKNAETKTNMAESFRRARAAAQREQDEERAVGGITGIETPAGARIKKELGAELQRTPEGELVLEPPAAKAVDKTTLSQLKEFKTAPDIKPLIQRQTAFTALESSLTSAREAQSAAAFGAALTQFSKSAGEQRITDQDIERIRPNPDLLSKAKRASKRLFQGKPLEADIKELEIVAEAARGRLAQEMLQKATTFAKSRARLAGVPEEELLNNVLIDNGLDPEKIKIDAMSDEELVAAAKEAVTAGNQSMFDKIQARARRLKTLRE